MLDATVGRQLTKTIGEIDDDSNLFDLGLDSIGFINIIIEIEKNFGIEIQQEEMELERFNTIRAIQHSVERKGTQVHS